MLEDTTADKPADPKAPTAVAERWLAEIKASQKAQHDFVKRGRKIMKRYRSSTRDDQPVAAGAKYNIFWSNIQTLAPATYSRRPKVEVSRRFRDGDPVGRVAGLILERALQYEVDQALNLHYTLQQVVLDRLLPGMGQVWVRYEALTEKRPVEVPGDGLSTKTELVDHLADEATPVDYVYWENFLCSPAQVWTDVTWVARQIPFSKAELEKRFAESIKAQGGEISDVQINYDPVKPVDPDSSMRSSDVESLAESKKALVWEIWDKIDRQIVFVSEGCPVPLDVRTEIPDLDEFWPCPRPVLATTTNNELTPVADFVVYQDQLNELDTLTNRISLLTSALRVIGVYDSSQDSLKDLLQSGLENRMVPVNAWAAFAEKGGLKGVTDFLPLDQVVKVLEGLYGAREQVKQTIFEITGMADIIRGASVASETLGAQQIKAKFANLRLSSRQQQIAEFVTRILQLKAQLMCQHYQPATIARIASADQMEEVKANPEILDLALQLLKDDRARSYRIEVAAESMIEMDEMDEQKRRNEFMSTVSNFFLAAKNIAQTAPEMMPVALEMLKFAIRGFPVGRSLEYALEEAELGVKKRLSQPPPEPKPEPSDMIKLEIERIRQAGEDRRTKFEADAQLRLAELKDESAKSIEALRNQHQQIATEAEQRFSFLTDRLSAQDQAREADKARMAEREQAEEAKAADSNKQLADAFNALREGLQQLAANDKLLLTALEQLAADVRKPRKRVPKYDSKGDIEYVDDFVTEPAPAGATLN
jgi:hypothetical protein